MRYYFLYPHKYKKELQTTWKKNCKQSKNKFQLLCSSWKKLKKKIVSCWLCPVFESIVNSFLASRNLKQEQIQIRLNLVVAIAIAQIVFLSGIDASERKVSRGVSWFSLLICNRKEILGFLNFSGNEVQRCFGTTSCHLMWFKFWIPLYVVVYRKSNNSPFPFWPCAA